MIALAVLAGLLFAATVVAAVEPEPATVACIGLGCRAPLQRASLTSCQREIGLLTTRRAFLNSRQNLNMPWGMTMPFSRYNADFNADLMEVMREAFHRVCHILQLSCDREDPLTELVVTKIVELAKAGEREPEILCIDVLAQLETPARGVTSPLLAPETSAAPADGPE